MPRAGYCSECGQQVWLTSDGYCQMGHHPDAVSGIYEAAEDETLSVPCTQTPEDQSEQAVPEDAPIASDWVLYGLAILLAVGAAAMNVLVFPAQGVAGSGHAPLTFISDAQANPVAILALFAGLLAHIRGMRSALPIIAIIWIVSVCAGVLVSSFL